MMNDTDRLENCFLFVVLDSLRYDSARLAWKSHHEKMTNSIADLGFCIRRGVSPATWTLPAVASYLTGKPAAEAVHRRSDKDRNPVPADYGVSPEVPMITEMTEMMDRFTNFNLWTNAAFVTKHHGFRRGWDNFVNVPSRDWMVMEDIMRRDDLVDDSFFYIHLMGTHYPWGAGGFHVLEHPFNQQPENWYKANVPVEEAKMFHGAQIAAAVYSYEYVMRLLTRFNDVTCIITGDHGEYFGEHGQVGHDNVLWNDRVLYDVPLILDPVLAREHHMELRDEVPDVTCWVWDRLRDRERLME